MIYNISVKNMETEKRYNSFGEFLKRKFGCKVYKISIDAGFTCPNRDGTLGRGGCLYCNNRGFSPNTRVGPRPVQEQIEQGVEFFRRKYKAEKFIAYYQAFTNTYGPYEKLKELYNQAFSHPDVIGISVGTRPDCLEDGAIDLLGEISRNKHVWIELGLQSVHNETLELINRKHSVEAYTDAVRRIKKYPGIHICAHIILGLPGETKEMMLDSAAYLNSLGVHGIKIHLMHVLRDTPLEKMYENGDVKIFSLDEYASLVCDYLELLSPDIVIQRLTADGPADLLIAPKWALEKKRTVDKIEKELLKRDTRQGAALTAGV